MTSGNITFLELLPCRSFHKSSGHLR